MLKHLKWYIKTSEAIPSTEKGPLLDSLTSAHRTLVKADRIEGRTREDEKRPLEDWFNERRAELGKKPWGQRRLVDELIRAILEK